MTALLAWPHPGPLRLALAGLTAAAMLANALRRRPWRGLVARWLAGAWRRPAAGDEPCRDCLRTGTVPPRRVTTVAHGQPTCDECAAVRRREQAALRREMEAAGYRLAYPGRVRKEGQ